MPPFSLAVQSFTPPDVPPGSSMAKPTTPLIFTLALPSRGNDPLYPATYLQLSWMYAGGRDIFAADIITARDLIKADGTEAGVYSVTIPGDQIPRMKLPAGVSGDVDIALHAWQGEKYLGKWDLGTVEGFGLVGASTSSC